MGRRHTSRVNGDWLRLSDGSNQLPHTAAGPLLIGCRTLERLSACCRSPNLGKLSLEHGSAHRIAVGGKHPSHSTDERKPDLRHLDRRVLAPKELDIAALLQLRQDGVACRSGP